MEIRFIYGLLVYDNFLFFCGVEQWAMSLREHWTVEPRIGDLYSTPIKCRKEGVFKDIEQIGSPCQESLQTLLSDTSAAEKTKKMSRWMSFKHFLKECEKRLSKVDLYSPDFVGLEVVGSKLSAKPAILPEGGAPHDSESIVGQAQDCNALDCDFEKLSGPKAELNIKKLFFHGKPGDHVRSSVILCNTGSTSLHFEWQRQPQISLSDSHNEESSMNRASFFYIVPIAGILEPAESKEFYVEFWPQFPGMFVDSWMLVFSPQLSIPLQTLDLLGAAALVEDEASVSHRQLLQQTLKIRERSRGLEEIFDEILDKSVKQAHISFRKAPDFIASEQFFDFLRSNFECSKQTPLYYNPQLFLQFHDIAAEVQKRSEATSPESSLSDDENSVSSSPPVWDMSVVTLMENLDIVDSDESWKLNMKQKVSTLQFLASIPSHPTAVLCTVMYKALLNIVSQIEVIMEERDKDSASEVSSNSTTLTSDEDHARVPTKQLELKDSGRSFGNSLLKKRSENVNSNHALSAKSSANSQLKQTSMNANMHPASLLKRMSTGGLTMQASPNRNMGLTNMVKGYGESSASTAANPASKYPSTHMLKEQANTPELSEADEVTYEKKIRHLFEEGLLEPFFDGITEAITKLAPVVERRIEDYFGADDEASASWLFLWFIRLKHALKVLMSGIK
ncbi:hypothetical protein KP509_1Z251200 [Ceratopteris richardii]|nr:hypothetical protein KP509_1Z251200 [Ceratopteris richardii]